MTKLNFSFDLQSSVILKMSPAELARLRRAGLGTIHVQGYFFGKTEDTPENIALAGERLRGEGFATGVLNIPLGHGGNAVDPDNADFDLGIGEGWRARTDARGRIVPNTACPDEKVIADSLAANRMFRDMGFDNIWNDDDLRLGMWGPGIQGCFCDRCMAEFCALYGADVTRGEIASGTDAALTEAWEEHQCAKIRRFLLGTTPEGMTNGIMVMHNGDRRHGIDIPMLREAMPDTLRFRVGEGHFDDRSFTDPKGRESLRRSIRRHMALVGRPELCFSETTCYPKGALSPENWVEKMRVEIRCGLRNLFVMSGQWLFTEPYWAALEKALPELRDLAENTPFPEGELPEMTWDW